MIPVKLKLRNFMPYRDNVPPLSFAGIHTACISGDNGNGKSALIDAMTWALWGKTRAKSDDDLIHQGGAETEVEFEFTVTGQSYRIIRKRARPKSRGRSGQSSLDLFIASNGDFKVISGDSIAQTQQKIIDVLRMDYLTFTNSALLRQGHADEFTQQPPLKRKEVLANILGLALYDKLEEQAKERAKQQELAKAQLDSASKDISDELAQKPAYQAEFDQTQHELSRIEAVIKEQESALNRLRQEKESLENKKLQLTQLESHITATQRELARREEEVKQHRSRLKEYQELIAQRSAIEAGYARLTQAKKLNDELDQKFRQSVNLERQRAQLDARIKEAGHILNTEHAVVLGEIKNLAAKAEKLPDLKNQLNQAQTKIRQLADQEATLRRKEQAKQELQSQVSHMAAEKARLEREISELGEKIDLLSHQAEARCPLCETKLSVEGLKLIENKYITDKQRKSDVLNSNQAELAARQAELDSLRKETTRLESWLNEEKTKAQNQASILKKEIAEIEQADKQLAGLRQTLDDIEQRLAKKDFALAEQEALAEIETELANLGYNHEKHEEARQQLSQLEPHEAEQRKLEEAERLINQEKESLTRAGEAAQELRQKLEADSQKEQDLSRELNTLPQLTTDLTEAEREHQEMVGQQKHTQEIMWSAKTKLARCAELEIKKREKEGLSAQASKQENIYRELAEAFGKKGIQNLIIETALPEIEVEANRLLARMTDNRMHVKLETQRATKTGGVIETLDINISDELGTRNYEMFSGGEAFRIDFAVRIALSKLLAKRAGAPLPTLIIDEGFGTQDSTGIEKLKEAINSIQEDFDKILIITHLDELKDAFPSRIDVIKTAAGATLEVC